MTMTEHSSDTLFIADLPTMSDDNTLRELFGRFGEIMKISIKRGEDSRGKKDYGFIKFADGDAAGRCYDEMNGVVFQGRALRLGRTNAHKKIVKQNPSHQLATRTAQVLVSFVSNQVNFVVSDELLERLFCPFGFVVKASIKKSNINAQPFLQTGYGFIDFECSPGGIRSALSAIEAIRNVHIGGILYTCSCSSSLTQLLTELGIKPPVETNVRNGQGMQRARSNSMNHGGSFISNNTSNSSSFHAQNYNNSNSNRSSFSSPNSINSMDSSEDPSLATDEMQGRVPSMQPMAFGAGGAGNLSLNMPQQQPIHFANFQQQTRMNAGGYPSGSYPMMNMMAQPGGGASPFSGATGYDLLSSGAIMQNQSSTMMPSTLMGPGPAVGMFNNGTFLNSDSGAGACILNTASSGAGSGSGNKSPRNYNNIANNVGVGGGGIGGIYSMVNPVSGLPTYYMYSNGGFGGSQDQQGVKLHSGAAPTSTPLMMMMPMQQQQISPNGGGGVGAGSVAVTTPTNASRASAAAASAVAMSGAFSPSNSNPTTPRNNNKYLVGGPHSQQQQQQQMHTNMQQILQANASNNTMYNYSMNNTMMPQQQQQQRMFQPQVQSILAPQANNSNNFQPHHQQQQQQQQQVFTTVM